MPQINSTTVGSLFPNTSTGAPNPNQIMKDSRYASYAYGGTEYNQLHRAPRHRFLYYAVFNRPSNVGNEERYGDWKDGNSFLIKSIDRPKITIDTATNVNEYNKKRVVQRSVQYSPINVSFTDTYDDKALKMVLDYLKFYYGDFLLEDQKDWTHDMATQNFFQPGNYGFRTPKTRNNVSNEAYFFSSLDLYQFGIGKYTKWSYINPKITDFTPSSFDAGDGSNAGDISLTIAYEAVVVNDASFQQNITSAVVETLGIAKDEIAQFYDLPLDNIPINTANDTTTNNNAQANTNTTNPNTIASTPFSLSQFSQLLGAAFQNNIQASALSGFGNFNFGNSAGSQIRSPNTASYGSTGMALESAIGSVMRNGIIDKGLATVIAQSSIANGLPVTSVDPRVFQSVNEVLAPQTQIGRATNNWNSADTPTTRMINLSRGIQPSDIRTTDPSGNTIRRNNIYGNG